MRAETFIRLIVPGGRRLGDTVTAEFQFTAPSDRRGELLATIPQPATFVSGASGVPLAPFFRASPIWRLGPDGSVVFIEPSEYRIEWRVNDGVSRRLLVAARRRPVTSEELETLSARYIAKMPQNNARFLAAIEEDLARRRREASRYHPLVSDLHVDEAGQLWVRGAPDVDTDSVRWDVFSPDLSVVQALQFDGLDRVLYANGRRLLLSRATARGEREVVLYDLTMGERDQ